MASDDLDDLDRHILHLLQEDARHHSATDMAAETGVTANTVRNRIGRLEERGIVDGYVPVVRYERAGYQLTVTMRCTAPVPDRTALASEALSVPGVVAVRELMTGKRNVEVTVVAAEGEHITESARELYELGLAIEDEELVKNDYVQPFTGFRPEGAEP